MTGTVGEVRGTPQKVREGQEGCEEVPYLSISSASEAPVRRWAGFILVGGKPLGSCQQGVAGRIHQKKSPS